MGEQAVAQATHVRLTWAAGLLAGAGAGIVAALACLTAGHLMGSPLPPSVPAAGSAFAAGLLGGVLYVWLCRFTSRPWLTFAILTLLFATIDSLLIYKLPLPDVIETPPGVPIYGLLVPLRQVAALLGMGHQGHDYFPAASLPADAVMHFVTALVIILLVPLWATRARSM